MHVLIAYRSLDDKISTTLEQLRLIQDGDCCVVRCFNTSANGLVNRGDSFKRKNEALLNASSSDAAGGPDVTVRAVPGQRSRSPSNSSNSQTSYSVPPPQLVAAAANVVNVRNLCLLYV